jgi:hypothetical protein
LHHNGKPKLLNSLTRNCRRGTPRTILLSIGLTGIHNTHRPGCTVWVNTCIATLPLRAINILQTPIIAAVILRNMHLLGQTNKNSRQKRS